MQSKMSLVGDYDILRRGFENFSLVAGSVMQQSLGSNQLTGNAHSLISAEKMNKGKGLYIPSLVFGFFPF